jgi:hypothetical protein
MQAKVRAQQLLTFAGTLLNKSHIRQLNSAVNYLEVGRWLSASGYSGPRYPGREEMYRAIGAPIAGEKILYLEFGVYYGNSIRCWAKILTHPQASLHGFDSFEGLPEDWDDDRPKGEFNMDGRMPEIADKRVELHKGWFSDTLPKFEVPQHDRLVIHLDADLYSSTDFVLRELEPHIAAGTILIFDEFCDRQHELRAFQHYLDRTRQRFEFIGGTANLEQVAFRRI